jgi:DNA polymerase-3 subunit beta
MKLTMERATLLKALGHVQSVVERRNTIPILSNVLLSAGQGQVRFSATDLDLEVADSAPAQVERTGQVTAPVHTLFEIVRELPEGADVLLGYAGEDPRLEVRSGRSRFNLPALPAGDFPLMSSEGLSDPAEIGTGELIRLIDKTRFAISAEETRYTLNGLYLHVVEADGVAMLRAAATDTRRLAVAQMPAPAGFSGMTGVIVPRKTITEARRLMADAGQSVAIGVSAQKVRFGFDHAAITSKVIDGAYPDYARLVPRENGRVVRVDNGLFAAAVRRVAAVSAEQYRLVRLSVETGCMTLAVRNPDAGQAVEEVEVDYAGEPFEIGFNSRYLLDVAALIEGEWIEFRFSSRADGALDPALAVDPADAGVHYVLAPARV